MLKKAARVSIRAAFYSMPKTAKIEITLRQRLQQ